MDSSIRPICIAFIQKLALQNLADILAGGVLHKGNRLFPLVTHQNICHIRQRNNTNQLLCFIHNEQCTGGTHPHAVPRLLYRIILFQQQRLIKRHIIQLHSCILNIHRLRHLKLFQNKIRFRIQFSQTAGNGIDSQLLLQLCICNCRYNGIRIRILVPDNMNNVFHYGFTPLFSYVHCTLFSPFFPVVALSFAAL